RIASQFGSHQLEGDDAVQILIVGLVDLTHSAFANQGFDAVARAEIVARLELERSARNRRTGESGSLAVHRALRRSRYTCGRGDNADDGFSVILSHRQAGPTTWTTYCISGRLGMAFGADHSIEARRLVGQVGNLRRVGTAPSEA